MAKKLFKYLSVLALLSTSSCGLVEIPDFSILPGGSSSNNTSSDNNTSNQPFGEESSRKDSRDELGEPIKIWVDSSMVNDVQEIVNEYKDKSFYKIEVEIEEVDPSMVAHKLLIDPSAGADIFFFYSDFFEMLTRESLLARLNTFPYSSTNEPINRNIESAKRAVTYADDYYYAFPVAINSVYFMYYDKRIITKEEADSGDLDLLLSICNQKNKTFSFQYDQAWYAMSLFHSMGLHSFWETNSTDNYVGYSDNLYSQSGIDVLTAFRDLYNTYPGVIQSLGDYDAFRNNSAVVISGGWVYEEAARAMGNENVGIAQLPRIRVNSQSYQLSSFITYTLLGVKPQIDSTARKGEIGELASLLASKESQEKYFYSNNYRFPTNAESLSEPMIKSNVLRDVIVEESNYAVPQPYYPANWWDSLAHVMHRTIESGYDVEQALREYSENLDSFLS